MAQNDHPEEHMYASIAEQIVATSVHEYEAEERLSREIETAEANGFTPDPEVVDARDAIYDEWARQQDDEINAEMAIERYYEGGWDKTGEYSDPRFN